MLKRPIFKPHYHVEVLEGEGVFVLSTARQTVLQGQLYERVVPLLDGRPLEDVCQGLGDQFSPARVFYMLNKLEQNGYLCELADTCPDEKAALWTARGLDPVAGTRHLATTTVEVITLGIDVEPLRSMLESLDVHLSEAADLEVVVTDHYLRKELSAFNRKALRCGRPWLLIKPVGSQVWVGPLFRPGKTACWECLARRIRSNHPIIGYLDSIRGEHGTPAFDRGSTPATLSVAWGLTAQVIVSWIAEGGESSLLEGKIQTLDLINLETRSHTLIRHPSCPVCGSVAGPTERPARPLILDSRRKTYTEDGGHRSLSPQETLDKYNYHVSPICGAVTILERSSPADDSVMHVYVSGNNMARDLDSFRNQKVDLRNSSYGKGTNALQAKASALCEGLERYSGVFQGDEPRRTACFQDLGDAAIHPNDCMLFSEEQYRGRDAWNAMCSIYTYIPRPFDPEREIEWTPAWSLTRQTARYLPTAFCYFNYPNVCNQDFCVSCSNGNAAGNTIEEAILQGVLELVERDSVGLWWYNRVRMPGVDLDSFDEPYLERLGTYLKKHQRDLWVLDLTSDLKIPVFAAISHRTKEPIEQIMFGFGAHLDPRIALLRAVTELNQMLVPLLTAPPDSIPAHLSDEETVEWLKSATLADQPFLIPRETSPRTSASYPRSWTDDLKEDLLICQSRVEELGLEMLVLDQTRPEIGMPVVKVIVPGLRHFWPRFAPGRLYDAPVRLGWIQAPLAEAELNPLPMFL